MMTELMQERTSFLRMIVELPGPNRVDEQQPIVSLVHLLADREGALERTAIADGDGEPTWEDAAWQ
jgi:hypothetical protein